MPSEQLDQLALRTQIAIRRLDKILNMQGDPDMIWREFQMLVNVSKEYCESQGYDFSEVEVA